MAYNSLTKLKDNIQALEIALNWDGVSKLSPGQISNLKQYSSFGGLKAILYGDGPLEDWKDASAADRSLYTEFRKLYDLLDDCLTGREYKTVLESMKNSILTSYYTPSVIPSTFYRVLKQYKQVSWMYEPSAGAGVFITETEGVLPVNYIAACEKDIPTGRVLKAIVSKMDKLVSVFVEGFEESNSSDNGEYDLVVTNPPYGSFPVFDPSLPREVTSKIHNYFFAKGLTKLTDQGILAYLVTSAFLDTVTNKSAREYLFINSDFISLTVMPDNLMKDTGNTEAPSHFLVVRKVSGKTELSNEEKLLCESENISVQVDGTGKTVTVSRNKYIQKHEAEITIGSMKIGKNQYGKPTVEVWWDGNIKDIDVQFQEILEKDFRKRYSIKVEEGYWKSAEKKDEANWETDPVQKLANVIADKHGIHHPDLSKDEEVPWDQEEKEFTQAGLTGPYIVEQTREVSEEKKVTVEFVDNLFNENTVPFKPGVIMNRRICKKDLFTDEYELIQVQSVNKDGQIVSTVPELKPGRETEMMKAYMEIRDSYYQLELAEQNQ